MMKPFERFTSFFLLGKARKALGKAYRLYRKKEKSLDPLSKSKIQTLLIELRSAVLEKNGKLAKELTHKLHEAAHTLMPKNSFEKVRDAVFSLGFALIVAVIIRTMWFEPYTIPTGSMRPTLKEGDFLLVSKTDFGINVPLRPSHFYFDPTLVQRGSIFVFSAENMDIADSDTTYFYLFPGKKLFVKRLIGKPGDTLYFYGGKIYGIDQAGKAIDDFQKPWFQALEHIPFIRFHGHVTTSGLEQGIFKTATLHQMGKTIAKLDITPFGTISGAMIPEKGKEPLSHYSDLLGMRNFAMARLLTPEQAENIYPESTTDLESGTLYLELTHHPHLQGGELIRDEHFRLRPDLGLHTSLLPLSKEHIEKIARHLTTCRFIVEKGIAHRYGMPSQISSSFLPRLADIPDGTYEILDGKAYQILWGNISKELPKTHPIYQTNSERVQLLYNLGIEFINAYNPTSKNRIFPSRYAYFRNGDL
ncbi:MAG: signal peptidase I, partial [Chlamydiae bacterium]|nr:signal peptidase I [Chlamydiota bacterium]